MSDDTNQIIEAPVRDPVTGHFLKGNKGGPGNPNVVEMARFRRAFIASVKEGDIEEVTRMLVTKAKGGDIKAATLFFEVAGLRVKQINAEVTGIQITPEEADRRIRAFFGLDNAA